MVGRFYTLQRIPPSKPGAHSALYVVITVSLLRSPVLSFTSPGLFGNHQSVLFIPFPFLQLATLPFTVPEEKSFLWGEDVTLQVHVPTTLWNLPAADGLL